MVDVLPIGLGEEIKMTRTKTDKRIDQNRVRGLCVFLVTCQYNR